MDDPEILILEGARTPFAAWSGGARGDGGVGGALRGLDPFDLGAAALRGALARAGLAAEALDVVVFGKAYDVGAHACYGARYVGLRAGVPARAAGLTVSLACGSGLQAMISAASEIAAGRARVAAAVGADSPSLVPRAVFAPSFRDLACGRHIAETAQRLAAQAGFTRAALDAWALESHRRAARARTAGTFRAEIVPAGGVEEDDAIVAGATPELFARAALLFDAGTATRANTHAIVDGASALVMAAAGAAGGRPLGRYLGGAVIGLPPEQMARACVEAVRRLLARLRLGVADVDLFEINETFAAQMLIDVKELGLPADKVNVNGGGLSIGHPFGGTGCRLAHTLLLELRRRSLRRGVAAICVGGGLGVAVAVESLPGAGSS